MSYFFPFYCRGKVGSLPNVSFNYASQNYVWAMVQIRGGRRDIGTKCTPMPTY